MEHVQIGEPAPDFTLPDADGKPVSLRGFRGKKVVLFFYPQDMTPTCTQQSCEFRDAYAEFRKLDAEVVGISPDNEASHRKFRLQYGLPYLLLCDEQREVCRLYDVWQLKKLYGREYMGVERSTFVIDEEGNLVKEWRKVRLKNHISQVLDAVKGNS